MIKSTKTMIDGYRFDSASEAAEYTDLKYRQMAGEISNVRLQVTHTLIRANDKFKAWTYTTDFEYYDNKLKEKMYIDVKGGRTPKQIKAVKKLLPYKKFKLAQKMMYDRFGIEVREVWR